MGTAFAAVDSGAIRVHRGRCAKVRNRNVDCLKCAAACTSGCISLEDGELVIDAAKCVGCGTCATVCPTCALEAHHPGDAALVAAARASRAANAGAVLIGCGALLERARGRYDEERVVLRTGRLTVRIIGRRLRLTKLTQSSAMIEGVIMGLEYSY